MIDASFKLGSWTVHPQENRLVGDSIVTLEPKAMEVLVYLASRAGEAVAIAEILDGVWGEAVVEEQAVRKRIWELRNALGDDARQPRYLRTNSKHGYEVIAKVEGLTARRAAPIHLAILPFVNLSADEADAWIAMALSETLLTGIPKDILVTTPNAGAVEAEIQPITLELCATIQVTGLQLRVTVRLTEPSTRQLVWADKFDGTLGEILELEDRLTEAVVNTLRRERRQPTPP